MASKNAFVFQRVPRLQTSSLAVASRQLQPLWAEKKSRGLWSPTDLTWLLPSLSSYLESIRKCCQLYLRHKPQICLPWFSHPQLSHHCDIPTSTLVPLEAILHTVARLSQREHQSDLITLRLKALRRLLITPRVKSKLLPTAPRALHHTVLPTSSVSPLSLLQP